MSEFDSPKVDDMLTIFRAIAGRVDKVDRIERKAEIARQVDKLASDLAEAVRAQERVAELELQLGRAAVLLDEASNLFRNCSPSYSLGGVSKWQETYTEWKGPSQ